MDADLKKLLKEITNHYFDCGGSNSASLIIDFMIRIEPLIDKALQESYRKGYEDSLKIYSK